MMDALKQKLGRKPPAKATCTALATNAATAGPSTCRGARKVG
jgi:hypothetical protein